MTTTRIKRLWNWAKSSPTPLDSTRSTEARSAITSDLWAYGIGAAVLVAISGDFIAAMPGPVRLVLALAVTLSLVLMHWALAAKTRGWRAILFAPPICAALYFVTHTGVFFDQATRDLEANDNRCLAIQRDMLSSMPLRSDDPDLFQALGCHPQGDGSVYAERDTKDDADAAIEQSARRSALPYRNPFQSGSHGAELK